MAPHRSRKVAPIEITTDDEDMITYDVEEEELEQDPPNKFTIDENPLNFPKGYLRSLTPFRYRNTKFGSSAIKPHNHSLTHSTSSSSAQAHLLPSPSAIIPTIQSESLLKIPIPTTTTASPSNNLNTSVSCLETEPVLLQPCLKRNPRNRRKRPKVQKPEIEIKMTPHRPRKSAPTEYATGEEDMITYNVEEEELDPDPTFKFAFKESPTSYSKGYLRTLTPTRFRKSRS
ncbi:hypothetical protein TNCV_2496071 [Trichonephila clavipes]|nr:hypothetical protein TNCV_2496071 [Trichonephila clavipes]